MSEKIRNLLSETLGVKGLILFLFLMMTAGITVVALLSGKTIKMEQEASDLSKAVLIAASAADIWYEAEDPEEFREIVTEHWSFTEETEGIYRGPEGFQIRIVAGDAANDPAGDGGTENDGTETAVLLIFKNGTEVYRLNLKKAAALSRKEEAWNDICTV